MIQYGPGGNGTKEIMVHAKRILHFDPDMLKKTHEYAFNDTVKLLVRLSVPARSNTKFKIKSQAFKPDDSEKPEDSKKPDDSEKTDNSEKKVDCQADYIAEFPAGSSVCAVSVKLDSVPATLTEDKFNCDIQLEPLTGNVSAPGDEDQEKDQLSITLQLPRVGFDESEPIMPPVNKEEGVEAVCGEGTKLKLKLSLSSPALPGTKARIVAYAFANDSYEVEFEENSTSKEVEVELKRGDNDKPMTLIILAEELCVTDSNADDTAGRNRIKVFVKRLPQISFMVSAA